jgi:hypothetical protein
MRFAMDSRGESVLGAALGLEPAPSTYLIAMLTSITAVQASVDSGPSGAPLVLARQRLGVEQAVNCSRDLDFRQGSIHW